jgi:hypothetical protein
MTQLPPTHNSAFTDLNSNHSQYSFSFNRLDLPKFASYHELKEKLKLAIYNTEGFDGVD